MSLETIRCSSLPLAFRCPGSIHRHGQTIAVDHWNEAAEIGSAVHLAFERWLVDDAVQDLDAIARKFGVDGEEVESLFWKATQLWENIKEACGPNFRTEVAMRAEIGNWELTGHADVVAQPFPNKLVVVDLKTGRRDVDHSHQLRGYGALALKGFAGVDEVITCILWARTGEVEIESFTIEQIGEWEERLRTEVIQWDQRYVAGGHCSFCPVKDHCPARDQMIEATASALAEGESVGSLLLDLESEDEETKANAAEKAIRLFERAAVVSKLAETYRDALKMKIDSIGPITDGVQEMAVDTRRRRTLITPIAVDVLSQYMAPEDLLECATISKTKALAMATEGAVKGTKGKIKAKLNHELDAAGAFNENEFKVLTLGRKREEIDDKAI